jgi:type I restriction enzyme M protein
MFETTFRNLDDTLRKDAGCSSELDYIEHSCDGDTVSYVSKLKLAKQ